MADINVNIRTTAATAERETRGLTDQLIKMNSVITASLFAYSAYQNRQRLTSQSATELATQIRRQGREMGRARVFFEAGAAGLTLFSSGIEAAALGLNRFLRSGNPLSRWFRQNTSLAEHSMGVFSRANMTWAREGRNVTRTLRETERAAIAYRNAQDVAALGSAGLRVANNRLAASFREGILPGLKNVGSRLLSLGGTLAKLTIAFKLAVPVIGLFVAGMAALTLGAVSLVNKLNQVELSARRLGASTDFIQQISFAADQAGTSLATLQSVAASADLSAFGDSFEDRIRNIADHLASYSDHSARAAEATRIFGRRGLELLPLLEGGSTALDDYAQQFENTGNRIDEQSVRTAQRIRDQFNVIKTTVSGSFNSLLAEGLPILEEFVDKTLLLINHTLVPAFKAATTVVGAFTKTLEGFGVVTRPADQELVRLAQSAGINEQQFKKLFESFDQGHVSLKDYFTTSKDLATLYEEQRAEQERLTRAYIVHRQQLIETHRSTQDYAASIGLDLAPQLSVAEQAAKRQVAEYDRIRQANAQAEVTTRMFIGSIYDEVGAANAAVTANNALAQSIDGVANAQQRYTLARGDILQARVGLAQTRAHAVSQSFNDPVQIAGTVATAVAEGISGTMEEAVARAMGRVATSEFPISMTEAIEAATIDWNMRQTNDGTLELLQRGETHLQTVISEARESYRQQVDQQRWWENAEARREATAQRRADEARRQRNELIRAINQERRSDAQALFRGGGSAVGDDVDPLARVAYYLALRRYGNAAISGGRVTTRNAQGITIVVRAENGQLVEVVNNGIADGSVNVVSN